MTATMPAQDVDVQALAAQLRIDSIRCTTAAGSGHPTSAMSAADLMAVLLAKYLRYDFDTPKHPNNDSLIFSKGHACPLLYAAYKAAGAVSDEELLTLRQFHSRLQGHPTPEIPWVEAATGSLGQGIAVGIGDALAGKYLDKLPYHTWVILGDSEMAEGSVWEAFAAASFYKLNNITAIIDVNRLGQRGETMLGHHIEIYAERARAFGWHAIPIDGHNFGEIERAFSEVGTSDQPTCIIAHTYKGYGSTITQDKPNFHGKALSEEQAKQAIAELGGKHDMVIAVNKPEDLQPAAPVVKPSEKITYSKDEKVPTRQAYGDALKSFGLSDGKVVVLDAEVSNSTYAEIFKKEVPERFFEMYIAEQLMVSAAVGLQHRGYKPFCSTFSAFFARAYDQVRMAAVSLAHLKLCGSHAGVSIGEDGPSQMALEDLSMMRAVCDSTVLYPSDATCTVALVEKMKEMNDIVFMRSTREKTAILYGPDEEFPIGGSKTVRDGNDATLIAAGITLHESLKAADQLAGEGINVRVIDLYSVKPVDTPSLQKAARETPHLLVIEDHWREGGLGDAVLSSLAEEDTYPRRFSHLCVHKMPRSGKPDELLADQGIDAKAIVEAVKAGR